MLMASARLCTLALRQVGSSIPLGPSTDLVGRRSCRSWRMWWLEKYPQTIQLLIPELLNVTLYGKIVLADVMKLITLR